MKNNIILLSAASLISMSSHALIINDSTHLDIYGAESFITANDSSTISIYQGADVAFLDAMDGSSVNVSGGEISWLAGYNNSTLDITAGDISWIKTYNNSTTNITYLDDLSWLVVNDDSIVNIYANDFSYNGGHLSGTWGNGNDFSFWALEEEDLSIGKTDGYLPDNILLHKASVPAPTPFLLFAFSLVAFVRRQKNRK